MEEEDKDEDEDINHVAFPPSYRRTNCLGEEGPSSTPTPTLTRMTTTTTATTLAVVVGRRHRFRHRRTRACPSLLMDMPRCEPRAKPRAEPRAPHVCHKSHGGRSHRSHIGIAQTILIIQNRTIGRNHQKGANNPNDCTKGSCIIRRGSEGIFCNLESSHNFNIISKPNVLIWLC